MTRTIYILAFVICAIAPTSARGRKRKASIRESTIHFATRT